MTLEIKVVFFCNFPPISPQGGFTLKMYVFATPGQGGLASIIFRMCPHTAYGMRQHAFLDLKIVSTYLLSLSSRNITLYFSKKLIYITTNMFYLTTYKRIFFID